MDTQTLLASIDRRRFLALSTGGAAAAVLPAAPARPATPPLFLLETHVAGTAYYRADEVRENLRVGQPLILAREPANPHDALAIEVFTSEGVKLGYVPRVRNPPFARLMDAGRTVLARLAATGPREWDDIRMKLLLADD